jgi:DHA1 family multidrug resistance protein-like MFS transporter
MADRCHADTSEEEVVSREGSLWRRVLFRREILSICLFVFTADVIIGIISPTLSLFARSLGASLTLVGGLATVVGVGRLTSSLVIGSISDRRGRRKLLMVGMACLGVPSLLYTVVPTPYLLLPIHAVLGVGFVSTLTIGFAYASDVVSGRERSLVVGLAATSMGLGFAVGSLVGGTIAVDWGYQTGYWVAAVIAVAGFLIGWRGVPAERRRTEPGASEDQPPLGHGIRELLVDPIVRAVCVGSVLSNLVFGGVVVAFFPIYADGLGITQATIGSIFAIRALASTLARLPAGVLGTFLPGHRILLAGVGVATAVTLSLPQITHPNLLMLFLVGEGIAYGVFLTSGQTTIANRAGESHHGAALGLYMASASVGDSVGPLFLGVIADAWGIRSVFYVVGGLSVLGVALLAQIFSRQPIPVSMN